MKDYYKILGCDRNSSEAEIKKAYRRMAREMHPDLAGDTPENQEAFKEVQNAYAVLNDPQKKAVYDQGVDPLDPNAARSPFGGGFGGFSGGGFDFGDINDIFDMFTGGSSRSNSRTRQTTNKGEDVLKSLKLDLAEAIFGCEKTIIANLNVACGTCAGSGSKSKAGKKTCGTCNGAGQVMTVQQSLFGQIRQQMVCPECHGSGSTVSDPCVDCQGQGVMVSREKLDLTIPKGVRHGNRIRYSGMGNAGLQGAESGDLYLEIRIKEDEIFEITGNDLLCKIQLGLTTALLGGSFEVDTFDGKQTIAVDPCTSFGSIITLSGLGLPTNVRSETRGNLKVFVEVNFPNKLSKKEVSLIEELGKGLKDDKQKYKLENLQKGGFFNKLRKVFG
jgi:molecular chaperone DnaJ